MKRIEFASGEKGAFIPKEDLAMIVSSLEEVARSIAYGDCVTQSDARFLFDLVEMAKKRVPKVRLKEFLECVDTGPDEIEWMEGK